jgi:hypothetical protein
MDPQERIEGLCQVAEEENIRINPTSLQDVRLWASQPREGWNLFLLERGNFRAIRKYHVEHQEGIEFLGNGRLRRTVIRRGKDGRLEAPSQEVPLTAAPSGAGLER